jgi:hypothetical protein
MSTVLLGETDEDAFMQHAITLVLTRPCAAVFATPAPIL